VKKERPTPARPAELPTRIAPSDDTAETVERIVSRRQLPLEDGDVVIRREEVPPLKKTHVERHWQYRLEIRGKANAPLIFDSFQNAASVGEELASKHRARLFYVEDERPVLLSDHRV
jgi:hypothetical protein